MTVLEAMREEVYPGYLAKAIEGYAQDNVAAGRWTVEGAHERSGQSCALLLPQGLETPNNHIFEIKTEEGGDTVGYLWIAIEKHPGGADAFVYNVEIIETFRRQGHATRAFRALEALGPSLGFSSIGLHVFGHNPAAQALYRGLGYEVTGINMAKRLRPA